MIICQLPLFLQLFISNIDFIERKIYDSTAIINIKCKDFRNIQLLISDIPKATDAFESIDKLMKISGGKSMQNFQFNAFTSLPSLFVV